MTVTVTMTITVIVGDVASERARPSRARVVSSRTRARSMARPRRGWTTARAFFLALVRAIVLALVKVFINVIVATTAHVNRDFLSTMTYVIPIRTTTVTTE